MDQAMEGVQRFNGSKPLCAMKGTVRVLLRAVDLAAQDQEPPCEA